MPAVFDSTKITRRREENFEVARQRQIDQISGCSGARSIREFGGLYLVNGRYPLEAAVKLNAKFVSMVDLTLNPEFKKEIANARRSLPDLEVEFINSDFRIPQLYDVIKPVDVSILYNVLLHQENYMSVIGGVCRKTNMNICVAQPCFLDRHFSVPDSATLLQFWPEEVKDRFRQGAYWPKEGEVPSFQTNCWMWGHSTSHLIACFHGFGWSLQSGEIFEGVLGEHWDYPILKFAPRGTSAP